MRTAWPIFKRNPVSVIVYLIYTFLCCFTLIASLYNAEKIKHAIQGEKHTGYGGFTAGLVFLVLIGFPFLLISMLNVARDKEQQKFYIRLSSLIVIQFFVLIFLIGIISDIFHQS